MPISHIVNIFPEDVQILSVKLNAIFKYNSVVQYNCIVSITLDCGALLLML